MRLINTSTLEFEECEGNEHRSYAILSHRWGKQEVSYQDYLEGRKRDGEGFFKIQRLCAQAASHGCEWAWIDTCCIDKKSSAELSEAINSMWTYYYQSTFCFAYLADVTANDLQGCTSDWFSRGWTLQELLAPRQVQFFNQSWECVVWKTENSRELAAITRIPELCLISRDAIPDKSIAQRMSWVSRRNTTRPEDMAYCLLGLFDVNMPLLYGEGRNAFMRLQLEIIRKSDDESIFAWKDNLITEWGMLAPSPRAFRESGHVLAYEGYEDQLTPENLNYASPKPYSMTNAGLEICKRLHPLSESIRKQHDIWKPERTFALVLRCYAVDPKTELPNFTYILVERKRSSWNRVYCEILGFAKEDLSLLHSDIPAQTLFVLQPNWHWTQTSYLWP